MPIIINPSDSRPLYIQIMDEVRRSIAIGSLAVDDPLPSVRQLATSLRVNPNTVAQAYRELEREGRVYTRRGQGTFVSAIPDADPERQVLIMQLARRTLVEGSRLGLDGDQLIDAIRAAASETLEGEPSDDG